MPTPETDQPVYGMLGKLPPVDDPRTLKLARYIQLSALPVAPAQRSWDRGITQWGTMANDRIGDCTCAAAGHQIQAWTANASSEVTISDADVIAAYAAVTGFDPVTGANDHGANELAVLNYWRQSGIGGHKLGAFADVEVKSHSLVEAAVNLFGGVYIGIALPKSAQAQTGHVWDVPAGGATGDGAPGTWGGHAVTVIDYDDTGPVVVTWGFLQKMTWAFWDAYVDEVHCLLGPEWFGPNAMAPSGFNLAQLQADLAEISGGPGPTPGPAAVVTITEPANGATLTGPTEGVTWTASGSTSFMLMAGTVAAPQAYFTSAQLPAAVTTCTATGLPADGSSVTFSVYAIGGDGHEVLSQVTCTASKPAPTPTPTPDPLLPDWQWLAAVAQWAQRTDVTPAERANEAAVLLDVFAHAYPGAGGR